MFPSDDDAKPRASDGPPFAIEQGAVTVPDGVIKPGVILTRRDDPLKGAVSLKFGDLNLDREKPMQFEVPEALFREPGQQK